MHKWENAKHVISEIKFIEYDARPTQNTYHNLRPDNIIASFLLNFGILLGLGLQLCVKEERPNKNVLDDTFARFVRDVRLFFFAGVKSKTEQQEISYQVYLESNYCISIR